MPFYEGTDGAYVVLFGDGDVAMLAGYIEDEPDMGALELMGSIDKHEVGEPMTGYEKCVGKSSEEYGFKPQVRLAFRNKKSFDALLSGLNDLKEDMEKRGYWLGQEIPEPEVESG